MRYWWVNQNQTFKQEFDGGYLWSPKRKSNGHRNAFYDFMRDVALGDVIFSYVATRIVAIGIAVGACREAPKPTEFGSAGQNWSTIGWKVPVKYQKLATPVRPKDHMALLAPLLPEKYSPVRANGNGLQSVYLASVPERLAQVLIGLVGHDAIHFDIATENGSAVSYDNGRIPAEVVDWEQHIEDELRADNSLGTTEVNRLVQARRGQGQFRENVLSIEKRCRVTKVDRPEHLIASHCKPWRHCKTSDERLDGSNGLMLTPNIDHLFDRGFISFENDGRILIAPAVHDKSLDRLGLSDRTLKVGHFSEEQSRYLDFHRESVFLSSSLVIEHEKG